jgi:two-component system LytT family response regulator
MQKKIKVAIVDDDESMHEILKEFYENSDLIKIAYTYLDSKKFIQEAPAIDFDICLLDINMPQMDGLTVAQVLGNKPYIFITGSEDKLKAALGLLPIDIVTKPFTKKRLDYALEKASKLINEKIEYGLFNVAESRKKQKLHLPDFLYITAADNDPRNKQLVMKGDIKYVLMNCNLQEIIAAAPHLVQVNRKDLVSIHLIKELNNDSVTLNNTELNDIPGEITLSPLYKKELLKRMFYK